MGPLEGKCLGKPQIQGRMGDVIQDDFEVYEDVHDLSTSDRQRETESLTEPDQTTAATREPLGDITAMITARYARYEETKERADLEKKGREQIHQKPGLPPRPQAAPQEGEPVPASAVKRGLSFTCERSPSKHLPR
jgi:hypothetical protein